jgi:hypothetical protein
MSKVCPALLTFFKAAEQGLHSKTKRTKVFFILFPFCRWKHIPRSSRFNRELFEVPTEEIQASSAQDADDRRRVNRRKIKLQRIFAAEVQMDGVIFGTRGAPAESGDPPQSCFVHIYDLSEVGMRVHTDFLFPANRDISIRLLLDVPVDLNVRLAWQKELVGGMHVVGLSFGDVSDGQLSQVREFLDRYSPENKRTTLRLQRMLMVEMMLGSISQKFGVFALDISTTGIRISHDYPLPEDLDIPFRILLEYNKPSIEVLARVTWQEENTLGQYIIGLVFVDPEDEVADRIEDFIETQVKGGASGPQNVLPLEAFEAP